MSDEFDAAAGTAESEAPSTATTGEKAARIEAATESRVVFTPSGTSGTVAEGTTVLAAARALGVDLDSVCSGRGICGRCQVQVSVGSFPKWGIDSAEAALSEPQSTETDYRGARPLAENARLGCAAEIRGDVVIDVFPASQVHRPVVRKALGSLGGPLTIDPVLRPVYVVPAAATLGGAASRTALITDAWTASGHDAPLRFSARALAQLGAPARTLDAEPAGITLVVREHPGLASPSESSDQSAIETDAAVVEAVLVGFVDRLFGVAIDIGSTTIAAHLVDLDTGEALASTGMMNPQIRFGEDLMSRVSHVMMHPEGAAELTALVRGALDATIDELLGAAAAAHDISTGQSIPTRDTVVAVTVVGNPIMGHLALGWDPTPLGVAPFTAVTTDEVSLPAVSVGIDLPNATATFLPLIGGHVGADTVAAVLAHDEPADGRSLLVDVGTNAEIVLQVGGRRIAASSPTGPAFEGAQLSCGQRASVGAIERVQIDPETLEPRFRVIGIEPWSDEPGFAEQAEKVRISGVCGSGIVELLAGLFLASAIRGDGTIDGARTARSRRIIQSGRSFSYVLVDRPDEPIVLTQNDVRAIQLAKAALRAGIDLLLAEADLAPGDLAEIAICGAFGAHLDPVATMVLGLIPAIDPARVSRLGNAAGAGAVRALLSGAERRRATEIANSAIKVELATEAAFQDRFVQAMAIPHQSADHSALDGLVRLPNAAAAATDGPRRRRGGASARRQR